MSLSKPMSDPPSPSAVIRRPELEDKMDEITARRCVQACAKYLRERDESPRAAKDLEQAVELLIQKGQQDGARAQREADADYVLRSFSINQELVFLNAVLELIADGIRRALPLPSPPEGAK